MQSLVGYSDSEDEGASPRAARARAGAAATESAGVEPAAHPPALPPAPPPVVTRIKGAASRGASPLVGVHLPSSTASRSPRPAPSSASYGPRRGSSSPPAVDRAAPQSTADRNAQREAVTSSERDPRAESAGPPPPDVRLDTLAEFGIPPVPTGPSKPSVQAKLANFHALRLSRGLHFNDSLHASKAFRNPRIYAKLVEFVDVDETGTNWNPEVWDPKGLGPQASASRIAIEQKAGSEARAAQPPGSRSSISFTSSGSVSAKTGRAADGRRGREGGDRRDRDMERERERERDRDRERDRGGNKKSSRWDRDRSRSPRRR